MATNRLFSNNKFAERSAFLGTGNVCRFISHQQNDKVMAKKIADYFLIIGMDVYFDEYDADLKFYHQNNNPKKVTEAICKGINNSNHMLVLISPNSLMSKWIPFEIGYGYDKTELAVLCLKGIPRGGLPEYIRTATVIRDIWDLEKGKGTPQILTETKAFSRTGNAQLILEDAMDKVIIGF